MSNHNNKRKSKKRSNRSSNGHGGDHSENSYMSNGDSTDQVLLAQNHHHPSENSSFSPLKPSSSSSSTSKKTPLLRTILLSVFVFVLGALSGVLYVSWVQHEYGFGKHPSLEKYWLPFGPGTAHFVKKQEDDDETIDSSSTRGKPRKKSLVLNKDNPQTSTTLLLPTLFGLNFEQILHTEESKASKKMKRRRNDYDVDLDWYQLSYTKPVSITSSEQDMIHQVAAKMHQHIPHLHERAAQVSWGGPKQAYHETNWWYPAGNNSVVNPQVDLDAIDGGHLLYAYLFIMKWNPNPKFPFRLCSNGDGGGGHGCPPERAIMHTLEWREKYKPWLVPPSLLKENSKGYVYHRGFSPETFEAAGRHGTVWVRVGHQVKHDLAFFRGILNAADRAIADSLVDSEGQVGKFNVIFDCAGFSFANTPSLSALKQAVTMLQDHYPNRLGMIFLAHISRPGEMFLRVVLRLITKEVRDKVKILPTQDQQKSLAILRMIVEEDYIPDWLGGPDDYRFHVDDYYPHYLHCTEEEAQEFITTMPYHAI